MTSIPADNVFSETMSEKEIEASDRRQKVLLEELCVRHDNFLVPQTDPVPN